jgi:hypothetical protein
MYNKLKGKLVTQNFHLFESGCYHINIAFAWTQSEHSWIYVLFVFPWLPRTHLVISLSRLHLHSGFLFTSPSVISYSISIMGRGALCFMGGVFLGVPLLPFTHLGTSFKISQHWMKQKNISLRCFCLYKFSAFWIHLPKKRHSYSKLSP